MAQGQLTVMQDLAGHDPRAKARASAALQAPYTLFSQKFFHPPHQF